MAHAPIFQTGEQVRTSGLVRAFVYDGKPVTGPLVPRPGDHPRYGRWLGHLPLPEGTEGVVMPLHSDVMAQLTTMLLEDGRIATVSSWHLRRL